MSITIRQVSTDQEYQQCLEIRRIVFIEEQGVPEEVEMDAYENEATHFLALYGSAPAATGRLRLKKGFVKFERIGTLPPFRGKGIAKALVKEMQKVTLEVFPGYLPAMHAQADATSFYLKLGWVAVGSPFEEAGILHQVMILPPKDPANLKCLSDPETPQSILDYFRKFRASS